MRKLTIVKQTVLLSTMILFYYGCKEKCSSENYKYNVRQETISNLPYTGYDALTFVRTSVGDTHVFIGSGKTMDVKLTRDAADCANTYTSNNYYYTYKSKTFSMPILIGYNTVMETYTNYLQFRNQKFEGNFYYNSQIPDVDSMIVLNNKYYNVQLIPHDSPNVSPFKAYFDRNFGCIKIIHTDGETWELLSLKN